MESGRLEDAVATLAPAVTGRTPFALLDRIGEAVGTGPVAAVNAFLEETARSDTMGGWVVIASAMRQQLVRDPAGAFARCRDYVVRADTWYATDILGERVPGPALVADFDRSLARLAPWRRDPNRWVRRTVGVAAHFWAKRSRGAAEFRARVPVLLDLLAPMFDEHNVDAVKGIGWGLKTLGRYCPDLVAAWLAPRVAAPGQRYRALMLRKALTYLPDAERRRVTGGTAR